MNIPAVAIYVFIIYLFLQFCTSIGIYYLSTRTLFTGKIVVLCWYWYFL